MRRAILDTDILSYIIDERYPEVLAQARQYFRVFRHFSVSAITVCEVVEGLESSFDHEGVRTFLKRAEGFEVLAVGMEEAVIAGRILAALQRTGQKVGELDLFIAAVAISNARPLVTNNQKHYRRIVDLGFSLELLNWREPSVPDV